MLKTTAVGNLVRDAELVSTNIDNVMTPRCRFTIAVNKQSRTGNNRTIFVDCTAWREYAVKIAPWLKKGRKILVMGETEIHQFPKRDGTVQANLQLTDVEVEYLDPKPTEKPVERPPEELPNEFDDSPF